MLIIPLVNSYDNWGTREGSIPDLGWVEKAVNALDQLHKALLLALAVTQEWALEMLQEKPVFLMKLNCLIGIAAGHAEILAPVLAVGSSGMTLVGSVAPSLLGRWLLHQ